ncbi:MAG: DUF3179 domain-containing protein [Planctomyces sp.]|nr:DUF3179 domain-containing protein [Planctomyces sp.]
MKISTRVLFVLGLFVAAGCDEQQAQQDLKPIPLGMMGALNTPFITPPVIAPITFRADEVTLPDEQIVIGVVQGGHARCYVKDVMRPIASHVVNDTVGITPVSITFCDERDCVRVFTTDKEGQLPDVKVGGFMNDEMALMVNGRMYSQSSKDIPLPEAEYELTKWGDWKAKYPETRVFLGYMEEEHGPKKETPVTP